MTSVGTDRPPDAALVRRPASVRVLWLLIAVMVPAALMVASVALGSRDVAWSDVWAALGAADGSLEQAAVTKRIPRTLLAMVIGAALALAGGVMQGVTRNPLADPGILGVKVGEGVSTPRQPRANGRIDNHRNRHIGIRGGKT
ncbi:iron chelate uptake ABC transporter family permease subunit [Streptosporangium soli]